jgi:type II secretory ATPase GspE/PulE/Tfp pilus assembly ATPase PilB-like protein
MLEAIGIGPRDWLHSDPPFRKGRGCDKCQQSGYKGRVGLYELFTVDENIRRMAVDRESSNKMKESAIKEHGMRTLLGDGRLAVLEGATTVEEVMRVAARESM